MSEKLFKAQQLRSSAPKNEKNEICDAHSAAAHQSSPDFGRRSKITTRNPNIPSLRGPFKLSLSLVKRVFIRVSPKKTAEALRRLAGCVAGFEVRLSRGEELTWSATSSAWLIRSPCPISPAAPKALQGGRYRARLLGDEVRRSRVLLLRLGRKMLRCCCSRRRLLLRPTILCALTARRPLWTPELKHATCTVRGAVRKLEWTAKKNSAHTLLSYK